MNRTFTLLALALLVSLPAVAADRLATLKTRDGRLLRGRVLQETGKGFLFRTDERTELIDYGNIDDLSYEGAVAPVSSAPAMAVPPPPPPGGVEASVGQRIEPASPSADGKGFRMGLGVTPMVFLPGAFDPYNYLFATGVAGQFHLNFGFGRFDVRISPTLGGQYLTYRYISVASFMFGVEATVRVNLASFYALGFGTYQGLQVSTGSGCYGSYCETLTGAAFSLSPVLYPAIFKFGEDKHQLALGLLFAGTLAPNPSFSPLPYVQLNYSWLF